MVSGKLRHVDILFYLDSPVADQIYEARWDKHADYNMPFIQENVGRQGENLLTTPRFGAGGGAL